jgi:hypothetical protein
VDPLFDFSPRRRQDPANRQLSTSSESTPAPVPTPHRSSVAKNHGLEKSTVTEFGQERDAQAVLAVLDFRQLTAILTGAVIVLSVGVICLLLLVVRQARAHGDSTIHVKLGDLPVDYQPLRWSSAPITTASETEHANANSQRSIGAPPEGKNNCQTAVADLAQLPLASEAFGPTFDDQRKQEEELRKQQDQAVLQEIFQENMRLRDRGVSLSAA